MLAWATAGHTYCRAWWGEPCKSGQGKRTGLGPPWSPARSLSVSRPRVGTTASVAGDRTSLVEDGAVLGDEPPLVAVLVAAQHYVGAGVVEVLPEPGHRAVVSLVGAGREARVVPVGQDAALGGGHQVGPQPARLGRPGAVGDAGVQRDQVPAAQVEAVVAAPPRLGPLAEVVEVAGCPGRPVLVVARHRPGPGLKTAPGRVVEAPVLAQPPARVRVVAEQQHGVRVQLQH